MTEIPTAEFAAPGPGGWMRLIDHFPSALTPEYQRLYSATAPPGMGAYMARYGVLARTLDVAYVHGHLYLTPVPLAGPRETKRTPPAAAVWLLSRMHPAFRRRTRSAERALRDRPWRTATAHWFDVERAHWVARIEAVQAIEPAGLTDDALAEHLVACRALAEDGYLRHFELHGDDLLPVGLLVARCAEWGIEPDVAVRALDGASPVSAGAHEPPAWQLVTGYDLDSLAWCELPTRGRDARPPSTVIAPLDLRALVPAEHHHELDALVSDARAAVPLRDDNGAVIGAWPLGLVRRAMLEAGRRLDLAAATDAVEATVDELVGRLRGADGPTAAELAERRVDRARCSALDAPAWLGPEMAIPPLTALPRALARIGAAQLATADHMMRSVQAVGVGTQAYTGRALVVDDPGRAMDLVEPGDIVVTRCTSPSWNVILVHAGALVTTTGGLLSHAATIARELGIPAVLGDASAMARLATGDVVTVDPCTAIVTTASTVPSR